MATPLQQLHIDQLTRILNANAWDVIGQLDQGSRVRLTLQRAYSPTAIPSPTTTFNQLAILVNPLGWTVTETRRDPTMLIAHIDLSSPPAA